MWSASEVSLLFSLPSDHSSPHMAAPESWGSHLALLPPCVSLGSVAAPLSLGRSLSLCLRGRLSVVLGSPNLPPMKDHWGGRNGFSLRPGCPGTINSYFTPAQPLHIVTGSSPSFLVPGSFRPHCSTEDDSRVGTPHLWLCRASVLFSLPGW